MHLLLCKKAPAPVLHVRGDPLHLPEQHSCPDRHSAVSTGLPPSPPALQESTSLLYPAGSSPGEGVMGATLFLAAWSSRTNSLPSLAGKANFSIGGSVL